jgi:hypothetical protein
MVSILRALAALALVALLAVLAWSWLDRQASSRARAEYSRERRAYAPRVLEELAPLPPELREASGLAVSRTQPGVVWSHNDSSDGPLLYAVDLEGRLLAKVALINTVAIDWEDIALGPCPSGIGVQPACLYIADTGNNYQSRDIVTVYVVAEPTVAGQDPSRPLFVEARSFRFRYPTLHEDTEALAVLPTGDVTIVTKGRTPTIAFFGFSKADVDRAIALEEVLTAVSQGDTGIAPEQRIGRWVTAAAMSPDGTTLAVRTYSEIYFYAAETGPDRRRWRDLRRPCLLGDVEPQGEAIDFLDATTLIIGSETSQGRQGVLHRVQCQS